MVAWVAMMGGNPGEGRYDMHPSVTAIRLFRINVWSTGIAIWLNFDLWLIKRPDMQTEQ
jgi:hypothetical protein